MASGRRDRTINKEDAMNAVQIIGIVVLVIVVLKVLGLW